MCRLMVFWTLRHNMEEIVIWPAHGVSIGALPGNQVIATHVSLYVDMVYVVIRGFDYLVFT